MKIKMIAFMAVFGTVLLGEKAKVGAAEVPDNMVWIPPGTFMMGSPKTELFRQSDETQHQITISHGFYISKYETTQREYKVLTGRDPMGKDLDSPVIYVSWLEAVSYCEKLNQLERVAGRVPNGYTYRLPTEAEWEYACRAGTTTPFHYGNDLRHDMANFSGIYEYIGEVNLIPNRNAKLLGYTITVGSYKPNLLGLYDMHGNVMEWCSDWYGSYPASAVTDPTGPATGSQRVLRGGGYSYAVQRCRSAYRHTFNNGPYESFGFRPVLAWDFSGWATDVFAKLPEPKQPTYSEPPKKEIGKDSLVVVTHGWRPDVKWLDDMTNAITTYLAAKGLNNWQVHAHKWVEKAQLPFAFGLGPEITLRIAKQEGKNLGEHLTTNKWVHIHLISHSAGAALIQSATEIIKLPDSSPNTVVHTTFLDAFTGATYGGKYDYGDKADWTDSYFSRDPETILTDKLLDHAYNVDITWLDNRRGEIQVSSSTSLGEVSQVCYQTVTSHGWPYQFYLNTIPPNTAFGSEGFGFPLSKEGGNWDFATNTYKVGKNALKVLGSSELPCVPNPSPNSLHIDSSWDLSKLPGASVIINSPEHVIIHGIDFELRTASPAWLAAVMPITNRVNFVSLEARFTSASGAEGLLTVYGETNVLGSVDERVTSGGIHQYTFPFPETATNGTRTLGFRLDAFSAVQSSATVTNVAFGFSGIKEPFSLSFAGTNANGLPLLQLNGPSGWNYRVETSTDLVDWTTVVILVNTNGIVRFVDPSTNNATARFYRAVAP